MEESINNRPEGSFDPDIKQFKEFIKSNKITWTEEEKKELEDPDPTSSAEEKLRNTGAHFSEMPYIRIEESLIDYVDKGFKIIGFDESSNTKSGTYAILGSFKFGEGQVTLTDGKYNIEKIMYKPISTYIEDNEHKLIIYQTVIENFVKTIKKIFYIGDLKNFIDELEEWYETTFSNKIKSAIDNHAFYYPSIAHVVDRIRTADEILKSLIRIKEESNWGKVENVVFLGDGIQMFRHHIFPPQAFTKFFFKFVESYNIHYYTISKTCRLRDAQGNFILPIWSEIMKEKSFLVEMPDLSAYTKSKAYIARIQKNSAALRFDIPDFLDTKDAKYILQNIMPYSPRGYPLCLKGAHEASTLLVSEYNKLESKFMELKFDERTKKYSESWRHKVLGE
ncbi:MAG: DNA double-strand break repair nuclease NurA [Candidatus Hodarchaeota archaeon]